MRDKKHETVPYVYKSTNGRKHSNTDMQNWARPTENDTMVYLQTNRATYGTKEATKLEGGKSVLHPAGQLTKLCTIVVRNAS